MNTHLDPVIELQGVDVYQKRSLVLSNVSFKIFPGEFVFLIGRTGSGKSSLLKTLYAELPLQMGTASVAGTPLTGLKKKGVQALRRSLGIVFQDFQLLTDRSVRDNLDFVLKATGWKSKAEREARMDEVLNLVGLKTKGFKYPAELSGGEQQRIVMARALLNNPKVLLADEPTGNLDPETSKEVMQILIEIARHGTAVLMASHDYYLIQQFPARVLKAENQMVSDLGSISG